MQIVAVRLCDMKGSWVKVFSIAQALFYSFSSTATVLVDAGPMASIVILAAAMFPIRRRRWGPFRVSCFKRWRDTMTQYHG
ncbi:MAG TPA: hypothetical protein DEF45_12740 [Rhodopirellula sp.]|nr:hypothetical protein [Rhodopirellula sp.]